LFLQQRGGMVRCRVAASRTFTVPQDRNHRAGDPRKTAEAAFKAATTKPPEAPPKTSALPGVKEMVSLRLDKDVLEHFQADGPGWQDRINAALRKVAGFG
jgi:uncharacterized protein (DUF4415 family)